MRERQHDGAAHLRLEGQRLLGDHLAVQRQREGEALGYVREVDERHERLGVEGADVVATHGQAGDGDIAPALADADPAHAHVVGLAPQRGRMGTVGEDMDLRPRILSDEGAGGADRLAQPVRQIGRGRAANGRQCLVPLVAEGRQHARLDGSLDDHHLGARPEPAHEVESQALAANEAGGRDVGRLHRGRRVEDDDDALGAVPHDRDGGAGQSQGEGEQREELQDQQRVALEALEEGRGLAIAQRRIPEEEARHRRLATPHLEEVQEHERDGQRTDQQREGREKAHARRSPLS